MFLLRKTLNPKPLSCFIFSLLLPLCFSPVTLNPNVHYEPARGMSERGLKCGYIWVDYTSIPQANAFQQQAAINSLAVYASLCSALVSVAPNCKHADTGADLNVQTYCARGWCRLELLSFKTGTCKAEDDETGSVLTVLHTLAVMGIMPENTTRILLIPRGREAEERAAYLCDGLSFKSIQESDVALEDDLVLHVLGGSFTCCSRCHPGGVQCDRQKTRDVLLGIYWRLLAMRRDGDMHLGLATLNPIL